MSILNVNQLQPVGGGNTITVGSSNIDYSGSITGNISVDGNLTVTGVVSNEDVTNIDSVGVITARSDISIADKIVHTGDTDTAIRFPAADTFSVETGGTERLRITSGGDFYMQGNAPTHTTSSGSIFLSPPSGNPSRGILWSNTSDTHYVKLEPAVIDGLVINGYSGVAFATGSRSNSTWAERLRITSAGLVGIATDAPSSALLDIATDSGSNDHLRLRRISSDSNVASNWSFKPYAGHLYFREGGSTDKIQFMNGGDVNIIDGNLVVADGHGIDFSATGNSSGSMSSELLDDYEEGTFTPTVYGSSTAGTFNIVAGGSNEGWYVKIGQYVHMMIRWKNVYLTGATGNLVLGNLPFSFDNTNSRLGGFSSYLEGFTPSFNKGFIGSQSVCFRRQSATSVTFRPSSANEWDVYYNAGAVSWQRNGGNSSQRTYGEIHLYGHTPS